MIKEFEGKTEREAIEKAAEALGLEQDEFDVEIVEAMKSGLFFKKGKVKIRVHIDDDEVNQQSDRLEAVNDAMPRSQTSQPLPEGEFERLICEFTKTVIEKMGYSGTTSILFREEKKLGVKIESPHSSIIIGKKGKNLDALQLIVNVYAGKLGMADVRIILDSENYRIRREESLVRLAYATAEKVRASRNSLLLEPMNPFERRLIHTTLNDIQDIETKSEGEGLYKQVRVYYKGRG
jgi:spoIIIJ-associated protein